MAEVLTPAAGVADIQEEQGRITNAEVEADLSIPEPTHSTSTESVKPMDRSEYLAVKE